MRSRKQQIRRQFQLESLEGRKAPSSVHGMGDHGAHPEVEVQMHHQGRNDGPGHDANDNRGGVPGRNDGPGHDANDNGGVPGRRGHDDQAGHDANDHRGRH